ncbi:MAG: hypothetical protein HOI53_00310 [Francisellaceae bacterium]|jgi:nucleotidyltransferase substrate binding protein (TIGR01987 family)|nr:hypothetical protein [Francisellaceae bacterium]MBT6206441.1 hypothetical protein [Francisellaceae bacterium]MBT6537970.1 hypothetical protein [Francisellaceae bacterium]
MLDLTMIKKASQQLRSSLKYCNAPENQVDKQLNMHLRSAAIQAFEFTYELSIKLIRRRLTDFDSATKISQLPFKDLIRQAAKVGLIEAPEAWFQFREMRNITSHAYEESKSKQIYQELPNFIKEVDFFIKQLELAS